jgi:DNA mismatch endonuclease (patch repair protein)
MDILSKKKRSWNMSRIKGTNTKPEKVVRSFLHRQGYRFVLHRRDLPGSPDVVLPKHKTVVFVHGCFWHRHEGCKFAYTPKTRRDFWEEKFRTNVERDVANTKKLEDLGWKVAVIWECQTEDPVQLENRIDAIFK